MSFNSIQFGIFLLVVFFLYWSLAGPARRELRLNMLLVASYIFYGGWNVRYLTLIVGISLINFFAGLAMKKSRREGIRKLTVAAALIASLGILGLFKYYNFFTSNLNDLFGVLRLDFRAPVSHLLLPVGISFYTFQCLSYAVDVYRRRMEATSSVRDFCLYVAFFPQLVAGPIVRAEHLLPQFRHDPVYDHDRVMRGLYQVLCGLFKKVVIADGLAVTLVDRTFADPATAPLPLAWAAMFAYPILIYCDFSGYSDVAIGSARMLGFELRPNFNRPYLAENVRDYWRRWHISFSTWLRDYVYVSLGGSRHGPARLYAALIVTMLVGGLWHGAAWTFIVWGAFHGVWMSLTRAFEARYGTRSHPGEFKRAIGGGAPEGWAAADGPPPPRPLWLWTKRLVTLTILSFGLLFFRSKDVATAFRFMAELFTGPLSLAGMSVAGLALMGLGYFLHFTPVGWRDKLGDVFVRMPFVLQGASIAFIFALVSLMKEISSPFIYFQF